ncbi:MAG: phosphodiester glycosidase family protein [Clostridia bacterium]|nr:phosphodiester glycosidase family protein [Clostridia bacterium]
MKMKRWLCLVLTAMLVLAAGSALAKTEPETKTLEETITWESDTLKITIDRWCHAFKKTDLRFYVAVVEATSPEQLRTAFAGERYSKEDTEATSDIAARHEAVLAINGDYYNYKDKIGLVIRNGELYRDLDGSRDHLLVEKDGSFVGITKAEYDPGHGEEYIARGVQQTFTFGPLLVRDGAMVELPKKYIIYTDDTIREPRTAIGWVDGTKYVVIVADGRRKDWSDKGMTLQELQEVFVQYGCQVAYNLDGGGSATMLLNGELVNRPSGSRQRDVSDIVYFSN